MTEPVYVYIKGEGWVATQSIQIDRIMWDDMPDRRERDSYKCIHCGRTPGRHYWGRPITEYLVCTYRGEQHGEFVKVT